MVNRILEAKVGLFHITILMRFAGVVGGGLHGVMGHERLIALGEMTFATALNGNDRCAEVIGPMLLRHPTELPEARLQSFP